MSLLANYTGLCCDVRQLGQNHFLSMTVGWCTELRVSQTSVMWQILGPEEPHPTKKSRVGKLHFRDDPVLVEKEMTVADPSATDIPQYYSCCHQRVYLSVGCNVWSTKSCGATRRCYCQCAAASRGKLRGVSGLAWAWVLLPPLEVQGGGRHWLLLQAGGREAQPAEGGLQYWGQLEGGGVDKTKTRTKLHYIVRFNLLCNIYLQSLS